MCGGNVAMFYHILLNIGGAFSRKASSLMIVVAIETKGTIPTWLHFFKDIFAQCLLNIYHFETHTL